MTLTIDLPPEIEDRLAARAANQGVSLTAYVDRLLKSHVLEEPARTMTPKEVAAAWRAAAAVRRSNQPREHLQP